MFLLVPSKKKPLQWIRWWFCIVKQITAQQNKVHIILNGILKNLFEGNETIVACNLNANITIIAFLKASF